MIFVVDNYDSFTYNLVQALGKLDDRVEVARNDRFDPEAVLARRPRAVVISPGPGRPENAGRSIAMIAAAERAGVPLLGVCLGHQAIAAFHGGVVERAPAPRHGKSSPVRHDGSALFDGVREPVRGRAVPFARGPRRRPAAPSSPSRRAATTASSWRWRTGRSPCSASSSIPSRC